MPGLVIVESDATDTVLVAPITVPFEEAEYFLLDQRSQRPLSSDPRTLLAELNALHFRTYGRHFLDADFSWRDEDPVDIRRYLDGRYDIGLPVPAIRVNADTMNVERASGWTYHGPRKTARKAKPKKPVCVCRRK